MLVTHRKFLIFFGLFLSLDAFGARYNAFLMTGGFASWERFKETFSQVSSNDRAALSQRFKLNVSELYLEGLEWSFDLRDKYDFFDKVNRELIELSGSNTFQVQQLSARYTSPGKKMIGALGRFPIRSYGGEFLDGAELRAKVIHEITLGAFGGLNPKRPDQTYVDFNKDSYQLGAFTESFLRSGQEKHLYLIHAFHTHRDLSTTSRSFLFQDLEYQWSERDRVRSMIFLDFVPSLAVQNANLLLSNGWDNSLSTQLQYFIVDNIRYLRVANLLETLPASNYQEGTVRVKYFLSNSLQLSGWVLYGRRQSDQLEKTEAGIGTFHPKFYSNHLTLDLGLGYRKPFGGEDLFARGRLQYVSRQVEGSIFQEVAFEKRAGVSDSVPTLTDLTGTYYFPDSLFLSLSFQYARNSLVNIYSGYLQAGYRFGNTTLATRRDEAPTRSFW